MTDSQLLEEAAKGFQRYASEYEMTILHDEGRYRHLRFMSKGKSPGSFDLITWPYNLVVKTGSTYVFTIDATEDWFDVVRRSAQPGEVNEEYWAQKITAGTEGVIGYSVDLFKSRLEEQVEEWAKGSSPQVAANLRKVVEEHFFGDFSDYNVEYLEDAQQALSRFMFGETHRGSCVCGEKNESDCHGDLLCWTAMHARRCANPQFTTESFEGYRFTGWREWTLTDFTYQYLYACHALAWGVNRYVQSETDARTEKRE